MPTLQERDLPDAPLSREDPTLKLSHGHRVELELGRILHSTGQRTADETDFTAADSRRNGLHLHAFLTRPAEIAGGLITLRAKTPTAWPRRLISARPSDTEFSFERQPGTKSSSQTHLDRRFDQDRSDCSVAVNRDLAMRGWNYRGDSSCTVQPRRYS